MLCFLTILIKGWFKTNFQLFLAAMHLITIRNYSDNCGKWKLVVIETAWVGYRSLSTAHAAWMLQVEKYGNKESAVRVREELGKDIWLTFIQSNINLGLLVLVFLSASQCFYSVCEFIFYLLLLNSLAISNSLVHASPIWFFDWGYQMFCSHHS